MNIIDDIKLQYKIGGIANKMIYWNVGFFLLSIPLFYQFKLGFFDYPDWLAVSSEPLVFLYKPWTLLTYAFFHQGFLHLFFKTSNIMINSFNCHHFSHIIFTAGIAYHTGASP